MKLFSKEHYELMRMFESDFSHLRLDREDKEMWQKGAIYQSGETNNLFIAYRLGAAYGRAAS